MIFQRLSLAYCIPLFKDQSSFHEIRSLAICINWVNRKQLNILQIFVEYLKNCIVAYWRWFSPKSFLTNYIRRSTCSQTGCLLKTNRYTKLEKKKNLYMAISSALNVRNWWECSGDKLWVMNLWWSNFVAQDDKCDCRGGTKLHWVRKAIKIVFSF